MPIFRIPKESGPNGFFTTTSLSPILKTARVANATFAGLFIEVATKKVHITSLLSKRVDVLFSLLVQS